ncbi:MAG: chemotaxis protein CheW [Oligoflexales bacterium]
MIQDSQKNAVVLFSFGNYSFALSKDYIVKIAHYFPLSSACFLPKIFSGFFAFGKSHLPCLRLDRLIGCDDFEHIKQPQIMILRSGLKSAKNKLGLLVDEIDATFVPRKEHLTPLRTELRKNKWLQGEIVFGEKSYLLIDQNNLLLSIENYCLAEISNFSSL